MAHHNRTPQSILDAPKSTPVQVSEQHGTPRVERRHFTNRLSGGEKGATVIIPKAARKPATNVPFVAPAPGYFKGMSKKAMRHALRDRVTS